jgi:capsular exopolysaccharide synthesis family protein
VVTARLTSLVDAIGRGRSTGASSEALLNPLSLEAEPFRMLRAGVRFSSIGEPLRSIMVASARPRNGKSTVTANLALSFAQVGEQVLIVDADLRRPTLSDVFNIDSRVGLTTLLVRGGDLGDHVVADIHENLDLLPTGPLPPNPSELLSSPRMSDALARMSEMYDVVLVDAPPVLVATDAVVLASLVDGVITVVDLKRTRRRDLQRTLGLLDRAGARVVGSCVNRHGRATRGEAYY